MPLCKQTKPIFVDNYVEKQTCSGTKSACWALSAGWQAAKAQPAEKKIERKKNVKLLHEVKCVIGCEDASGKARGKRKVKVLLMWHLQSWTLCWGVLVSQKARSFYGGGIYKYTSYHSA